jgi:hypothetical protein
VSARSSVLTPGDNEWTDCHKKKEGGGAYNATTGQIDYVTDANGNLIDYSGGNPVDNLALVRSIFFPTPGGTLGAAGCGCSPRPRSTTTRTPPTVRTSRTLCGSATASCSPLEYLRLRANTRNQPTTATSFGPFSWQRVTQ